MSNIELIIFDFDGVIIDSEHLYNKANHKVLNAVGIHMTEADLHSRFIGMHFKKMLAELTEEFGVERTQNYADNIQSEIWKIMDTELVAIPHVIDFLETTKLPFYVGSNAGHSWITRKMDMLNIKHLFGENIIGADNVANAKPAPDMFKLAADRANVAYDKCAVIEDGIYGIQAARELGMYAIGFTGQSITLENHHQNLIDAGAHMTFDDMRKLPDIIKAI